jgi:hypothetical protein
MGFLRWLEGRERYGAGRLRSPARAAVVSVAEPPPSPFFAGPVGAAYRAEGTFGPGRYCGRIRTPITRRTADGRRARTGRFRSHFGCRLPGEVARRCP